MSKASMLTRHIFHSARGNMRQTIASFPRSSLPTIHSFSTIRRDFVSSSTSRPLAALYTTSPLQGNPTAYNQPILRHHQQQKSPQQQQYRYFSRSSLDAPETPADKAISFIVTIGYEQDLAKGIVDALRESGLSGEALLGTVRTLAGRWEVGEDEGLEALAASVKEELKARKNAKIVTVHVVPGNVWESGDEEEGKVDDRFDEVPCLDESSAQTKRRSFPVKAYAGTSLTDVAKFGTLEGAATLGEYLECACSGIMACSTCHVVVDSKWIARVGEAEEDEQDMIDLAYSPRRTSRLGCQIILTDELDGAVLWLPKGHNNLMDHIPFEG